jgi:MarR family transcriptional regulator for hemolysin
MTAHQSKPRLQRSPAVDGDHIPVAMIGRLHRRLKYRLDARLDPFGLTGVQWGVLARLSVEDGLSQTQLQHQMAIEGATLTHIVQRLEREGWIERQCDPADRRRQRVWLTQKSRDLMPAIALEVESHRGDAQRGLTPSDLETLKHLLDRIEENLV